MNENANVINGDGISIGNYIYIRESNEKTYTDFRDYVLNNGLYLHEYGHYLQLQSWGSWARLTGDLLSLGSAGLGWRSTPNHMDIWIERDANARAWAKYGHVMGDDAHAMFTGNGHYADRRYYDGRFFRNFLSFGNGWWLFYLYDLTFSN